MAGGWGGSRSLETEGWEAGTDRRRQREGAGRTDRPTERGLLQSRRNPRGIRALVGDPAGPPASAGAPGHREKPATWKRALTDPAAPSRTSHLGTERNTVPVSTSPPLCRPDGLRDPLLSGAQRPPPTTPP